MKHSLLKPEQGARILEVEGQGLMPKLFYPKLRFRMNNKRRFTSNKRWLNKINIIKKKLIINPDNNYEVWVTFRKWAHPLYLCLLFLNLNISSLSFSSAGSQWLHPQFHKPYLITNFKNFCIALNCFLNGAFFFKTLIFRL